jgi:hypothetical protein
MSKVLDEFIDPDQTAFVNDAEWYIVFVGSLYRRRGRYCQNFS